MKTTRLLCTHALQEEMASYKPHVKVEVVIGLLDHPYMQINIQVFLMQENFMMTRDSPKLLGLMGLSP